MSATLAAREPLDQALQSIPEWVAASKRLEAVGTYTPTFPDYEAEIDALVAQAIDSGVGITPELEAQAAQLRSAAEGPALINAAFNRHRVQLQDDVDNALRSNLRYVFANLDTQLRDLVHQGREAMEPLGGITDAEEAVEAGLLDELTTFRALGVRYTRLRRGQYRLFSEHDANGRSALAKNWVFNIADPISVDPDFLARHLTLRVESSTLIRDPRPAPWPEDWTTTRAFAWLASHQECRPWVPTSAKVDGILERLETIGRGVMQEVSHLSVRDRTYHVRPTEPLSEQLTKGFVL